MDYSQVAKFTGMLRPTVVYILKKFVRDGYQMINHYAAAATRWNPMRKITPEIE